MKSYIVVAMALVVAPVARSQSLDVSYQQKHATVQFQEMPHADVSAKGQDGVAHSFSCVPMKTILAAVQAPAGESLRGIGMSSVLIAGAKDNYHGVFTLSELDEKSPSLSATNRTGNR
jgi:hypothetical protein